ncbi:Mitochondrial import inner membrane translocase subunit tim22 [Tulasnella sp. JGI-2019a]|nr:Mitochondrial import inner membrane translocase subunit tim22 [Tulasnella sp. JGI-2019a]
MPPPPGLLAPIFAEGNEPLPPGWTEEDRLQAMTARKWEKFASSGMESCAAKSVMSGVVGVAAGAVLSLMGTTFSYEAAYGTHIQQSTPLWFKEQGQKMWKSGKGFGKVGALYAGTECVIESYRAKNDITNAVAAGFMSGGILARSSGPKAAFGGALAFAAFSAAIDVFLRRETSDDD